MAVPGEQKMVLEEGSHIGKEISMAFAKLEIIVRRQGTVERVPMFSGEAGQFKKWIGEIDKQAFVANLEENEKKYVALQASTGGVSDFILKKMKQNPEESWKEMLEDLRKRYTEEEDPHYAFTLLRKLRQEDRETAQEFGERTAKLAEEAYSVKEREESGVRRLLINIFIDGLRV
uniref:Retrotransposon gag domain-containing protein n=1 Tax=Arion vulgaris TaxID=1028688 RepID=A0A0B7BPG6_9EUPU